MPRILVVEDEPMISMLLEDWLNQLGCEVVGPARGVADGLAFAQGNELDGAILDVNLSDETCYPLARALRAKGVPVAFATGANGLDSEAGFDRPVLLSKPFLFEDVKSVLGKLLAPKA